jgi:hypothetical protein
VLHTWTGSRAFAMGSYAATDVRRRGKDAGSDAQERGAEDGNLIKGGTS